MSPYCQHFINNSAVSNVVLLLMWVRISASC